MTSPAIAQTQTAITDENGQYKVAQLPPGDYLVTFYYADITVERSGIHVGVEKTTPVFQKLNTQAAGGETIKIDDTAPTIDPTSTTQGITIDKNYMKNIPVPGRTFESALGAAAGSQGDGVGVSFSGSSSLENQYYVDGVNTTGLTYGTVGSPVINDFIEEIEVITGGYNAEYGRATGGVVNVVTKRGSNEFKGSVFGYCQPGFLTAAAERDAAATRPRSTSRGDVAYNADFGFELGGPIIKDKLWFFVGFAPAFAQVDYTRTTKRQTDCRKLPIGRTAQLVRRATRRLADRATATPTARPTSIRRPASTSPTRSTAKSAARRARRTTRSRKINYAATPGAPGPARASRRSRQRPLARASTARRASGTKYVEPRRPTSRRKWTCKFNDNKTEVEAVVGWHRETLRRATRSIRRVEHEPLPGAARRQPRHVGPRLRREPDARTPAAPTTRRRDSTIRTRSSRTARWTSRRTSIGGPGQHQPRHRGAPRRASSRVTQRVKAGGSHEIKAGIDVEDNLKRHGAPLLGRRVHPRTSSAPAQVYVNRWVQLARPERRPTRASTTRARRRIRRDRRDERRPRRSSATTSAACRARRARRSTGNTLNWSAYLRDSWQIRPNLTLNAGLRYEEQRLRYADVPAATRSIR